MCVLPRSIRSRMKGNTASDDAPRPIIFPENRLSDSSMDQSYHSRHHPHELPTPEQTKQLTAARRKAIFIASAIYMISAVLLVLVCCLEQRSGQAGF